MNSSDSSTESSVSVDLRLLLKSVPATERIGVVVRLASVGDADSQCTSYATLLTSEEIRRLDHDSNVVSISRSLAVSPLS